MSDDERLAALLDGRLDEREREAVLARLAASDDEYYLFTDTAALLRAMEEEEEEKVVPIAVPRRRRLANTARWAIALPLAATLAGVVFVSARAREDAAAGDPVRLAARLETEGLPAGWTGRARWSSERGGGPGGERGAQAVRAGALMVDLAVAVEARDAAATRLLAEQLRSRFDARAGATSPFARIAASAGSPPDRLQPLVDEGAERLGERLGRESLELGAWVEAGRLAAHARDEAFFRTRGSRAMLRRADGLTESDPAARASLARVRAALQVEGSTDWEALNSGIGALLAELAE